jgi:hypothetical protein
MAGDGSAEVLRRVSRLGVAKVFRCHMTPQDRHTHAYVDSSQTSWFPASVTLYFMTAILEIVLLLILFPLTLLVLYQWFLAIASFYRPR